jgi:hypothetical protein
VGVDPLEVQQRSAARGNLVAVAVEESGYSRNARAMPVSGRRHDGTPT